MDLVECEVQSFYLLSQVMTQVRSVHSRKLSCTCAQLDSSIWVSDREHPRVAKLLRISLYIVMRRLYETFEDPYFLFGLLDR